MPNTIINKTLFNHQRYQATAPIHLPDRQWPNKTIKTAPTWCSVDLRDGNQALANPMSVEQKKRFWRLLIELGFKQIEVGFPSASQPDYDFVRWLIEADQIPADVTIQVLVQARQDLIERTYKALEGADKAIVHVYNSTSPVQRNKVFQQDKAGIIAIAQQGARWVQQYAQQYPSTDWTFQYSPESFSSTEVDFATDVCNAVIDQWQPQNGQPVIINLPATIECASPNVFADQVEWFCRHVHQRSHICVSLHTHNDRGCAVAAAELAVMAGADRVEGTLLGNGERTGNMDIITMAMNLYSQGVDPLLDLSAADHIIDVVTETTEIAIHPRHPWFGELVYTAFSGSHQDAIRKCLAVQKDDEIWDVAYLPINPQDLGREYESVIRVNSQSGKGGAAYWIEQNLGLTLPRWLQQDFAIRVQKLSEISGKELSAEQLINEFGQHYFGQAELLESQCQQQGDQVHLQICATFDQQQTTQELNLNGIGIGSLDALLSALGKYEGCLIEVLEYDESRLPSLDASHQVSVSQTAISMVKLAIAGQIICACGRSTDILQSGLKAVLNAYEYYKNQANKKQKSEVTATLTE